MKNIFFIGSLILCLSYGYAQGLPTIKVDGNEVLVGAEGTLPLWLKSGQTLETGTNTPFISVLEFKKEALSGGGNSLIFEDVVIVTTPSQIVPNGKVWKVEATGIDKHSNLASTFITQGNNCEPPSNIQITNNPNKSITISWNAPNNPPAYGYLVAVMPSGVGPTSSNDFITITGATIYTTDSYTTTSISFGLTDDIDVYVVSSCNLNNQSNPINDNTTLTCQYDILYSFTNCGKTGYDGPSQNQCNSAYLSTSLDNGGSAPVTVTSGIQSWTVPTTGVYEIEVAGASSPSRGKGAIMKAQVLLNMGEVLQILVGQQGVTNSGSGGSYVVYGQYSTPLVIAGGGGGCVSPMAYSIATSDGKYDDATVFNGVAVNNLHTYNDGHGYVKITSIVCP